MLLLLYSKFNFKSLSCKLYSKVRMSYFMCDLDRKKVVISNFEAKNSLEEGKTIQINRTELFIYFARTS